jgi:HK97 family phage major capsid protein
MQEIQTLREQMASIATEARAKLSEVTDETEETRAAEIEREFDAMMADHDKLAARVEREDRVAQAFKKLEATDTTKIPEAEGRTAPAVDNGLTMDYRAAFAEMIANGGDAYVEPEVRNVLKEYRVQVGSTNSAGGYTVPTELATFIVESMKAFGPMYTANVFTSIETAAGNPFNIPTLDDTTVTAEAHTEGTQPTDDGGKDATFGQKTLNAYAFNTEWVRWSAELNADSVFNMESLLGRLLGERMGRIANAKLTTGSGSSDVEGIVTNSAAGVTAASATAVTADEIIDLVHSVDPAYRQSPNAAIMMNDSTLKAIRKLKDGNGNYLWQMGDFQIGTPQNILGYPVVVNQDMDSIATAKKTILFGDMSRFYVRKVGQPSIYVARERFAPDFGILGYIRLDGCLSDTAAVKHLVQA